VWAQTNFVNTSDRRFGLDMKGRATIFSTGLDRRLNDNVVVGTTVALQTSRTTGFGDFLTSESNGFSIGPYLAFRLSRQWAVDASLTYGRSRNELDLTVVSGNFSPETFSGAVNLHGQYNIADVNVRPKFSLFYSHIRSEAYDMNGIIFGFPIDVTLPSSKLNYGITEVSTEINRIFNLGKGAYIMPYAELALRYDFERPNDGEMLTGNLTVATPSPWAGSARAGFRMSIASAWLVEANAGYLSLGQNGLDIWEGRVRVSLGF
jgi:outer membrane autotransporter protein